MDPLREVAEVVERDARLVLKLGQGDACPVGVASELVAGQSQAGDQGDQLLLDPIVDVALDPPALGLLRVDDPRPRRGELVGLDPNLVDPRRELGCERGVVDGQGSLTGQGLEQGAVLIAVVAFKPGAALDHADRLLRAGDLERGAQ